MPHLLLSGSAVLSFLECSRLNDHYHHQARYHQCKCDRCHKRNRSPTGREFAPYNPVLRFEVSMEPHEKDRYADTEERRPQRFAHLAQVEVAVGLGRVT